MITIHTHNETYKCRCTPEQWQTYKRLIVLKLYGRATEQHWRHSFSPRDTWAQSTINAVQYTMDTDMVHVLHYLQPGSSIPQKQAAESLRLLKHVTDRMLIHAAAVLKIPAAPYLAIHRQLLNVMSYSMIKRVNIYMT